MGVKEKKRNKLTIRGELMENAKERAKEGIQHQGTRKPCVLKGSWRKEDATGARKGQRDRDGAQLSSRGVELARGD